MRAKPVREFLGALVTTIVYHPFSDRFRFARLKLWFWKRFRPAKYRTLETINLGCGASIYPGMCNVDVAGPADLRFNLLNRFPLPQGTAKIVYCEHALEHFHIDQVAHVLKEVHRILAPGGVLRISVPAVEAPAGQRPTAPRSWRVDEMEGKDLLELNRRIFGHDHKSIHSQAGLRELLRLAGFDEVRPSKEGSTVWFPLGLLRTVEHRTAGSLVVEARKREGGSEPPAADRHN